MTLIMEIEGQHIDPKQSWGPRWYFTCKTWNTSLIQRVIVFALLFCFWHSYLLFFKRRGKLLFLKNSHLPMLLLSNDYILLAQNNENLPMLLLSNDYILLAQNNENKTILVVNISESVHNCLEPGLNYEFLLVGGGQTYQNVYKLTVS